jgi:hypothetical protein
MPIITYPGVLGVLSLDATVSVGITPGTIALTAYANSLPAITGDLTFGLDAEHLITLPNCMLEHQEDVTEGSRRLKMIRLLDRRWMWRYGFPVNGDHNQQSAARKLIPWTVRSPYQLAYMLLDAMGELVDPAIQIDLPPGLACGPAVMGAKGPEDKVIDALSEYLKLGQNLEASFTNQPTTWQSLPAAQALANLAESYGRLIVLDPIEDIVKMVKIGSGIVPPDGVRMANSFTQSRDVIPSNVVARGSPTRYQIRFRLRAVGKEWDGSWVPLERLSYAPARNPLKMRVEATGAYDAGSTYHININDVNFNVGAGSGSLASVISSLETSVNASANPLVAGIATASVSGSKLVIEADTEGVEFEITTSGSTATAANWFLTCTHGPISGTRDQLNSHSVVWGLPIANGNTLSVVIDGNTYQDTVGAAGAEAAIQFIADQINLDVEDFTASAYGKSLLVTGKTAGVTLVVTAASTGSGGATVTEVASSSFTPKGWERTPYPFGFMAMATDQLTKVEARRLADESVFRCYQVIAEDPADSTEKSIPVPDVGNITNKYRIILQPTRPEPIQPNLADAAVLDPKTLQPFAAEYYNGYSVDRPNVAYGSVRWGILTSMGLIWNRVADSYLTHNTPPRTLLPIPFDIIDPEQQVVRFSVPVYRTLGKDAGFTSQPAELVIETGAMVLDANSAPICYEASHPVIGGFGPDATRIFPDIQREVVGIYDEYHTLLGFTEYDADARIRAEYYAKGWADTLEAPSGYTLRSSGLLQVGLDGLVRQISWSISASNVSTTIGVNSEFSRVVLPYPTRRKNENLPPDRAKSLSNFMGDYMRAGTSPNILSKIWGAKS